MRSKINSLIYHTTKIFCKQEQTILAQAKLITAANKKCEMNKNNRNTVHRIMSFIPE